MLIITQINWLRASKAKNKKGLLLVLFTYFLKPCLKFIFFKKKETLF